MSKKIFFSLLLFIATLFGGNNAAGQFLLTGELRPRNEYRHGLKTLASKDQAPAFFTSQRTRLLLDYQGEKFKIGFNLQDIRVWGSTSQLNITDNFSSVHEAWGEILFTQTINLLIGRQELIYDDHRIFGNVGWAQQGRSHDLFLFKYNEPDGFRVHLGFAFNQNKEQLVTTYYTVPKNYKTLQFLWFRKEWTNLGMSLLFLNNGFQYVDINDNQSVKFSQTFGTYTNYTMNDLKINFSGYFQNGKDENNNNLGAFLIGTEVVHPLGNGFSAAIGFELQSGTDEEDRINPDYGKNKSFTPFYGTNHKFNGHMDYFYVGNHVNNAGLRNIFLRINHKQGRLNSTLAVHHFSTAAKIMDPDNPGSTLKNSLGIEMDFSMGYNFAERMNIKWGYSQMVATTTMEALKGGDKKAMNNWAWLMFTFKPQFLQ